MRDWLATLLQVSFAARAEGEDLEGSFTLWVPLLERIGAKLQVQSSQLLSHALLRYLLVTEGVELSAEELNELHLPSKNDEMGSSLIETKLDDSTLALCFSFLDTKDVCTFIERTSQRFLQVSRNISQPFRQESMQWRTDVPWFEFNAEHSVKSPFDRLLHSVPNIPKPISLRSLRRFRIDTLCYDPKLAAVQHRTEHKLLFHDVIHEIASNVQLCVLYIAQPIGYTLFLPNDLSHITHWTIKNINSTQFHQFCNLYRSNCEDLTIETPLFSSFEDWQPLMMLKHLKYLDTDHVDPPDNFDEKDFTLDAQCFSNLVQITLDDDRLLPLFAPILTHHIRVLDLSLKSRLTSMVNCDVQSIDLSGLNEFRLHWLFDQQQSHTLKKIFKLPTKIPSLSLTIRDWAMLAEWVDMCADRLFIDIPRFPSEQPLLKQQSSKMIMDHWSVKHCSIDVSLPKKADIDFIQQLIQSFPQSDFDITLHYDPQIGGLKEMVQELESSLHTQSNYRLTQDITRQRL